MRVSGWEGRMAAVVQLYQARQFEWGEADCLLFALDVTDSIHGTDFTAMARGSYDTPGKARRKARRGLVRLLQRHGFEEVPVAFGQRGMVAIIESDGREAAAIVDGRDLLAMGDDGLVRRPRSDALKVFECHL